MNTGIRIKRYLESKGISQAFLSERSGIPAPKLNLVLNGKRRLTFDEYEVICYVLEVDAGTFIEPHPPSWAS